LKTSAVLLATSMTYAVPEQDFSIDLTRMPTLPASGFVMRQVRATGDARPAAMMPAAATPKTAAASGCPFHR
jgi:fatty-acid peroxygenase